jgi:hypothetical protein
MAHRSKRRRLTDGYSFPGFRALATVCGVFGDPRVRVVMLVRRSKKRSAAPATIGTVAGMTAGDGRFVICPAAMPESISTWKSGASIVGIAAP